MGFLTREQIASASDIPALKEVPVPEWGGSVGVKMLTAGGHARLGVEVPKLQPESYAFYLLSKTLCDGAGALLFDDEAGLAALAEKDKDVILRLYKEASEFNKLGEADAEAAAKN